MKSQKQQDVRLHHAYPNLGEQNKDMRNAIRLRRTNINFISWPLQRACVKKGIRTGYDYLAIR